jgi:hypothetical protein
MLYPSDFADSHIMPARPNNVREPPRRVGKTTSLNDLFTKAKKPRYNKRRQVRSAPRDVSAPGGCSALKTRLHQVDILPVIDHQELPRLPVPSGGSKSGALMISSFLDGSDQTIATSLPDSLEILKSGRF